LSDRASYFAATIPSVGAAARTEEYPAPELEPGAALLHTLYAEVCGTDVHLRDGRLAGVPYPLIPGHVAVGVIAEHRGELRDIHGNVFSDGDVVTFLDVHETCNNCYECLVTKQTTRCPNRKVYGITYGARDGLLGGWSEAIWMKPGVKLLRMPQGVEPAAFIGGGCGLVTAVHAVDRAEIKLGQSVVVLGAGPVGQSLVALSSLSGAGDVIAIGGPESRLSFAKRMGATATIGLDVPPPGRAALVRERTRGRGADVVIEASGAPDAVSQALDLVRDGGRVVISGQYTDRGATSINPHLQINRKHVEIRGCWGSDYSHFYRALDLVAQFGSKVPWIDLAEKHYALDEANDALDAVASQEVIKAIITPNSKQTTGPRSEESRLRGAG
jgi:threonine dehydrogenase-like Zn-dependent dehydrogenase